MADHAEFIKRMIEESVESKRRLLSEMTDRISSCAITITKALRSGGKVLLCGNGGSAAEAQHLASELIGRLWRLERPPISAIALTTDTSILTSLSNDFGFDEVFVRQIKGLGKPDDVLIAISTSGNSPNLVRAAQAARESQMYSIGLLGSTGGKLLEMVDDHVLVPSEAAPRIQESHHLLTHIFASIIEEELYGEGN